MALFSHGICDIGFAAENLCNSGRQVKLRVVLSGLAEGANAHEHAGFGTLPIGGTTQCCAGQGVFCGSREIEGRRSR